MKIRQCETKECPKRAISASRHCGEHTDNRLWLNSVYDRLAQSTKDLKHLLVCEIEAELQIEGKTFLDIEVNDCVFRDSKFSNLRFERCHFIEVEIIESQFENCVFHDCNFDQNYFFESNLLNCEISESAFENCQIGDGDTLDNTKFTLCKFSGTDFHDVGSALETHFLDCVFIRSSLNNSILKQTHFSSVEFSKTAIAFCDFRNAVFENIQYDFDEPGLAPVGCDFFGCALESDLVSVLTCNFNNTGEQERLIFLYNTIEELTQLGHPNYLNELTQFVKEFAQFGSIIQLKELVNNHYRELGKIAKDSDNVLMMGSLMNNYAHLPEEIRDTSTQLISMGSHVVKPDGFATLEITFQVEEGISFSVVSELNRLLDQLSNHVTPGASFDVLSIRRGSLIQTIQGSLPEIFTFGGTVFAFTLGSLQVMKSLTDIQKNLLSNKKTKIEIENLEKDRAMQEHQELAQTRTTEFLESIEYSDVSVDEIARSLDKLMADNETQELVKKIDQDFKVKKLRFEFD